MNPTVNVLEGISLLTNNLWNNIKVCWYSRAERVQIFPSEKAATLTENLSQLANTVMPRLNKNRKKYPFTHTRAECKVFNANLFQYYIFVIIIVKYSINTENTGNHIHLFIYSFIY